MYRSDIAEELGLEFKTLDDLDDTFAKVAEAYPDMTVCSFNCAHKFNWLMQQLGLKGNGYYETADGTRNGGSVRTDCLITIKRSMNGIARDI